MIVSDLNTKVVKIVNKPGGKNVTGGSPKVDQPMRLTIETWESCSPFRTH
jgi:hypothetical protein